MILKQNKKYLNFFIVIFITMLFALVVTFIFIDGDNNIPEYQLVAVNKEVKPMKVDISSLKEGEIRFYYWYSLPLAVFKRTSSQKNGLVFHDVLITDPFSLNQSFPKWWNKVNKVYMADEANEWLHNNFRSINPNIFVFVRAGVVTKCNVNKDKSLVRSFFSDHCSRMKYDLAGRVFQNGLYTNHLIIPNHRYIDENTIEFYPNDES